MASREEMLAEIKSLRDSSPVLTREQMIQEIKSLRDGSKGPSVGTSAVRQGIQGFTGGFSDEIAGGVEAAGRMAGIDGLGGPMKNISMNPEGMTINPDAIKQAYQAGRDQERQTLKQDSDTNPRTSLVANVVGGAVSPINKVAKGMSVAKTGATLGGIYGLGTSEADSVGGMVLDTATGAATGGILGKGLDQVGKAIAPAAQKIAQKTSPANVKLNKEEILSAADRLGIKVTPGMLDNSEFISRLEFTLANSPSILGQSVRRSQDDVVNALKQSVESATKEASGLSNVQTGQRFKSDLTAKIGERLDPITSVFDEVSQSTKFIPVSQRSKDAVINNIKKIDAYALTEGAGKPLQYVNMIGRLENADQVKQAMTLLNADIRAAQGAEKQVLIGIKNKLSTLEDNSITRAAIQQARDGGMQASTGKKIGSQIVGDLKDARSAYRELFSDLGQVSESARIKMQKGPSAFLDAVESIPDEKIQEKFFNSDNFRQLSSLKEKFPEQFDLLRQGKLRDILDSSKNYAQGANQDVSVQRFASEVRKLSPEAKQMIFGDSQALIKDIDTLQSAFPKNFNPSGSGTQASWNDVVAANVKSIPQYLLYKGASSNLGKKVGGAMSNIGDDTVNSLKDVTASGVKKIASPGARILPEQFATKGPEKWMAVGASKLQEHENSGFTPEQIEKIKKTKKGRELLIQASDLTPNSKAMNKVIEQIRSGSLESGE